MTPSDAAAAEAEAGRGPLPLEARYLLERPGFGLDVDLRVPGRGVTGVFGPSGAGKTTLLRCIAGLERARAARLRVDGRQWEDSEEGRRLPAHRRRVGYVFQEPSLFAHLDARGNVAYGHRRAPREERRIRIEEAVEWLGLGPLLDRRPDRLSGGERQRVAIARALVPGPRLLLMDEPLSSLDEPARQAIFPYLERLPERLSIPILYVSHSLREIARLADHLVWLVGGRVRAAGPCLDLVARIGGEAAATDEARVLVEAAVRAHEPEWHLSVLETPWGPMRVRRQERPPGARVRVQVLASDVSLGLRPERETSILNQFEMRVLGLRNAGDGEMLVRLRSEGGEGPPLLARITRLSRERLGLEPGSRVHARVKAVAVLE